MPKRNDGPVPDAPRPGLPVRGSTTGRPVMALLDLLGRRWALRVIWELRDAALTFRALQAACGGVSSSVLAARLGELVEAGAVERGSGGYALTGAGRELLASLEPLQRWAERWVERSAHEDRYVVRDGPDDGLHEPG
jgi:DNA-binding HxlR family transcriptional regulator